MTAAVHVVLGSHAVTDIRSAHAHYAALDGGLGSAFVEALDLAIQRLSIFPQGAPPVDGFPGLRRARMQRFPYGLFYRLSEDGTAVIVRVLHTAQDGATEL
ncbi:type II toxin-antitoxin system RelE/ParE family toxin [Calidifontibacter sp. DB0510]|uniref:Type II toxin-antitoxin system RelE/ParE family toxin n=1 Tax=Metallococcus carri TaxID=1656884 RepID=A0A967EHC7_9MICO|nr:type II toxin-antitoxin system RelE/ParE family toxin [Metallococcus carri]NHN56178.1 type II toxin-antitoxin system RelE/ParE family toxin [Metallococcus carri]NOP38771.1 type II toxin-antitoxin system RelE/ParE family toxin [Calidifontibacter sp. DB2511S]